MQEDGLCAAYSVYCIRSRLSIPRHSPTLHTETALSLLPASQANASRRRRSSEVSAAGSVRLHSLDRHLSSCRQRNSRRMCIRRNRSSHHVNHEATPLRNAHSYLSFSTSHFSPDGSTELCFQKPAFAVSARARSMRTPIFLPGS
jgi:hypothetical protein